MYMKLCFDTLLKLSFPTTSQITIFLILLGPLHPRGIGGEREGGLHASYSIIRFTHKKHDQKRGVPMWSLINNVCSH